MELYVTILAQRIWKYRLNFWKICAPLRASDEVQVVALK
jgi:hypothetical protein